MQLLFAVLVALLVPSALLMGGLRGLGSSLLTASFVCISWNATNIGGFQPGDLLLLGAIVVLAIDALRGGALLVIPRSLIVGAALIAVAGLLIAAFPPSPQYISGRFVVPDSYQLYGLHTVGGSNLTQVAKFEVALLALPLAVLLLRPSANELRRLAAAWAVSALVSAIVAILDASGFTHMSSDLLGYTPADGRQSGLSEQPVHLAVALVLTTPIIIGWLVSNRVLVRSAGVFGVPVVGEGILLSGSRAGVVASILSAAAVMILAPDLRRIARNALLALPVVLLAISAVFGSSVFNAVAKASRLSGGLGAASDAVRELAQQQALIDVRTNLLHGIGFDHLTEAHEVHLQLLVAGGILALAGYVVYWFGVLRLATVAWRLDPSLASPLLVSVCSFLAINFVENQVADRYLYVPVALLVALVATQRSAAASASALVRDRAGELPARRIGLDPGFAAKSASPIIRTR